jgi:hypothetical protein
LRLCEYVPEVFLGFGFCVRGPLENIRSVSVASNRGLADSLLFSAEDMGWLKRILGTVVMSVVCGSETESKELVIPIWANSDQDRTKLAMDSMLSMATPKEGSIFSISSKSVSILDVLTSSAYLFLTLLSDDIAGGAINGVKSGSEAEISVEVRLPPLKTSRVDCGSMLSSLVGDSSATVLEIDPSGGSV